MYTVVTSPYNTYSIMQVYITGDSALNEHILVYLFTFNIRLHVGHLAKHYNVNNVSLQK